jgi:DNA gyrase subunit A
MFATADGNVRRNKLSEFVEVRQSGKIAMKLDEGQRIIGVETCSADDDVLLTTARGRAIRFPMTAVREFKGREARGVMGIRLDAGDEVISMAMLRHVDAPPDERAAYLRQASAMRRAAGGQAAEEAAAEEAATEAETGDEEPVEPGELSPERYAELSAREQFILTASENGYGKRTSAYEYRISGRGGKGIIAMTVNERNGPLVGAFPVEDGDHIMLVTDRGKLIRCPVEDISIVGRATQGVKIFSTAAGERVVSVVHIPEEDNGGDSEGE